VHCDRRISAAELHHGLSGRGIQGGSARGGGSTILIGGVGVFR
jgi:hypothetical protein